MLCDLPNKLLTTIGFDLALYFMTNLRRTPGHFFVFLLFTFSCTLTMSMYFRSIAALSKTLAQVYQYVAVNLPALWLTTTGYGTSVGIQSGSGHLYRLRNPNKIHATVVRMASFSKPSGLRVRSSYDQRVPWGSDPMFKLCPNGPRIQQCDARREDLLDDRSFSWG